MPDSFTRSRRENDDDENEEEELARMCDDKRGREEGWEERGETE
jgi:hypothetical protein